MFNPINSNNEILWSFKTWIANFRDVDLPIGDLAKDIVGDLEFPDDDFFIDIYDHLRSKRADEIVTSTFVAAWNYYLASNAIPDGHKRLHNEILAHKDF